MRRSVRSIFPVLFLGLTVFCLPFAGRADTAATTDTPASLQVQIDSQNQALSTLDDEIAADQKQLTALGANKNTLSNAIKTLTLESDKLKADIAVSQNKIDTANLQIGSLQDSIVTTSQSVKDLKVAIAQNIRQLNTEDHDPLSSIIFSSSSLSNLWHYIGEQNAFTAGLKQKVAQLASTQTALVAEKGQVEAAKVQLVAANSELLDQKTINQTTQAQKTALLNQTKNQETAYQKLVAQKLAAKNQMTEDLANYESKLKYVLNPSSLPPPGSAPFAWPLDHIVITQLFGKTEASGRLYVSGTHNGVDFGTPIGTPVKAMASGTVIGSGNSDLSCPGASYGKWVFIKYDNGLASVYGHLSLIKTSTTNGLRVEPGDIVAYSGMTGYATGPHLHVSVFANTGVSINSFPSQACPGRTITIPTAAVNAYLDPMLYLPKPPANK